MNDSTFKSKVLSVMDRASDACKAFREKGDILEVDGKTYLSAEALEAFLATQDKLNAQSIMQAMYGDTDAHANVISVNTVIWRSILGYLTGGDLGVKRAKDEASSALVD